MDRRDFLKLASAGAGGALLPASRAWADAAGWRSFEVITEVELLDTGPTASLWLPLPLASVTTYSRPGGVRWQTNATRAEIVREPVYGAAMLHAQWTGVSAASPPRLTLATGVATHDRAVDLSRRPTSLAPANRDELALYLKPTNHIPLDGIVGATARKIALAAPGGDTLAKARAIYEWIVDNTYRNPKTRGCGTGDIRFLLESGDFGGKCADLNALFVGLARASGIPARDVYGVRVAASTAFKSLGREGDITKAQHCRAEFWHPAFGWVPVDPADVRKVVLEEEGQILPLDHDKVRAARAKLFGAWEMNWLPYNTAQDIALPAGGSTVGFLMYPYAETAKGKPDPLEPDFFSYTMKAREIRL